MQKSLLVLSGGLDSTVSSWIAKRETTPILALTFDYGQRAAEQEIKASRAIAQELQVPHEVIPLPWLAKITKTSLVNKNADLPALSEKQLDDTKKTLVSAKAVWIPNRNGIFLNIAAAYAESAGADLIVTGFNAEESVTFPDNSAAFVRAADEFFWYSTQSRVKVMSFTQQMTKEEIVKKGKTLGVDFSKTWSCYQGGKRPCRECESCLRSIRAFRLAGVTGHEN